MVTHMVSKQLHDKGGDAAVDADQDVDTGEDDVRGAWDLEEEGGRVHQRSDGPPEKYTQTFQGQCGALRCGVVRCGAVWCGVLWCGVVRCGVVRCGVVWCGAEWCNTVVLTRRAAAAVRVLAGWWMTRRHFVENR